MTFIFNVVEWTFGRLFVLEVERHFTADII